MNAGDESEQRAELIRETLYLMQRTKLAVGQLPIAMLSRDQAHSILISTIDKAEKIGMARAQKQFSSEAIVSYDEKNFVRLKNFYKNNRRILVAQLLMAVGVSIFLSTVFQIDPVGVVFAIVIVGIGWVILKGRGFEKTQ